MDKCQPGLRSGLGLMFLAATGYVAILGTEASVHHRTGTCLGQAQTQTLLHGLWFLRQTWGWVLFPGDGRLAFGG